MDTDDLRTLLLGAHRLVVMTGAGISTDSGIPDYRGPSGVWTRNPGAERTATLANYLADPEVRRRAWRNRLASPVFAAEPNAGHRALVVLERGGHLAAILTQNIDGLHQRAGSDPARVVELHGNVRDTVCWSCGDRRPMSETLERVRAGEDDPACLGCGGILKSAAISFGQPLDAAVLERAEAEVVAADVVCIFGSTLTVHPAAGLVPVARRHGARIAIVNAEPTAYDAIATAVIRAPISDVLTEVVAGLS